MRSTMWPVGMILAGLALAPVAASERAAAHDARGSAIGSVRFVETDLLLERSATSLARPVSADAPLAPGDTLSTTAGRAELDLSDGSVVFLDAATRVVLDVQAPAVDAHGRGILLRLERGAVRVDVRAPEASGRRVRIDTAAGTVLPLSPGSFRVDVQAGVTALKCERGVSELADDEGSVLLHSGQRSAVVREREPAEPHRSFTSSLPDAFDRFHAERLGGSGTYPAASAPPAATPPGMTAPTPSRPFDRLIGGTRLPTAAPARPQPRPADAHRTPSTAAPRSHPSPRDPRPPDDSETPAPDEPRNR